MLQGGFEKVREDSQTGQADDVELVDLDNTIHLDSSSDQLDSSTSSDNQAHGQHGHPPRLASVNQIAFLLIADIIGTGVLELPGNLRKLGYFAHNLTHPLINEITLINPNNYLNRLASWSIVFGILLPFESLYRCSAFTTTKSFPRYLIICGPIRSNWREKMVSNWWYIYGRLFWIFIRWIYVSIR